MDFIKFICSDSGTFLGFIILLGIILDFIYNVIKKIIDGNNIKKWGYPPSKDELKK